MRCLAGLLLVFATSLVAAQERVQVTGGQIEGETNPDGIRIFKGIPFAAAPIGDLRWRPPQPVEHWEGIREAKDFGPMPAQGSLFGLAEGSSEDCLHLNVWTPAKAADEKLPVMVWIFGGGFNVGSASLPLTDGSILAKHGVVVVALNHRVGPFGFLAHPELSHENGGSSGNYGLRDQIAALQWIRDNIAAFGGDSSNVTIFGGSSGGISVSFLAASPLAKGLFHRAISQSGGAFAPPLTSPDQFGQLAPTLAIAEEQGKAFLASIDAKDIASARSLSTEAVLKGKGAFFWPNFDGEVVPGDLQGLYEAGKFNETPLLAGSTSDDAGGFFIFQSATPEQFIEETRKMAGDYADIFLAAYAHDTPDSALRSKKDMLGDMLFRWPTWAWARAQSEWGKNKSFIYYFDFPKGAGVHCGETPYVFGRPPSSGIPFFKSVKPFDAELSDQLIQYWTNFAKTGDPNGGGLTEWQAFMGENPKVMVIDDSPAMEVVPHIDRLKALDAFYDGRRKQGAK